ncbi:6-bladed beta-propeller [Roseivirga echinicomitans]
MTYKTLLLSLITLAVFGCSNPETKNERFITINAAQPNLDKPVESKELFTSIEIIPLETTDDLLMVGANQVEFFDDQYFVLDGKMQKLFVFDSQGNFKYQIGTEGDGPGEYREIVNFEIDEESQNLYMYTPNQMAIQVYSTSGEHLEKIKLDFYSSGFNLLGNGKLAFYIGYNTSDISDYYNVLITDMEGGILNKYFPYPESVRVGVAFSGLFVGKGNSGFHAHAFSDSLELVNIETGEIEQSIKFDFEGKEWPHGFNFNKLGSIDISWLNTALFYDDHFLFQGVKHERRNRHLIYNRKNGHAFNEHDVSEDFLFKMISTPKTVLSNGSYVASLSAQKISSLKRIYPDEWSQFEVNYPELVAPLMEFENEQNPVLILFKLNGDL